MNQNLITKYEISFSNTITDWPRRGKVIEKIPITNNQSLSNFLYDWDAELINEILLPDIDTALANFDSEIESGSETVSISIYQDRVDFYPDGYSSFTIPTVDFKEIVLGWRDFLLTPPLNGTKK